MRAKAKKTAGSTKAKTPSPVIRVRTVPKPVEVQLFVRSGGRCEFPGCSKYLLEHHLTLTPGNFAQIAHIVAFSRRGPRTNAKLPATYINDLSNLMFLCHACHKLIDDHALDHPVKQLRQNKASHEDRIYHLTGISDDLKTNIVQLTARIAGRTPAIAYSQIAAAVSPRYPVDKKGLVIDLSTISSTGSSFVEVAQAEIKTKIAQLSTVGLDRSEVQHLSVFAMAPIPLLIFLGRELSDKVNIDVFQRHRDTEDWTWKPSGAPAEYQLRNIRVGTSPENVALCLSLSGCIDTDALPPAIDRSFTVYELTLSSTAPTPMFLRTRTDLANFVREYQTALRSITRDHAGIKELHLFPAVPAPIAVHCGRALLPKIDPTLLVYDADKANDGFTLVTKVN